MFVLTRALRGTPQHSSELHNELGVIYRRLPRHCSYFNVPKLPLFTVRSVSQLAPTWFYQILAPVREFAVHKCSCLPWGLAAVRVTQTVHTDLWNCTNLSYNLASSSDILQYGRHRVHSLFASETAWSRLFDKGDTDGSNSRCLFCSFYSIASISVLSDRRGLCGCGKLEQSL